MAGGDFGWAGLCRLWHGPQCFPAGWYVGALEFPSMRTGIFRGVWNDCARQGRKTLTQSSANLSLPNLQPGLPFLSNSGDYDKIKNIGKRQRRRLLPERGAFS